MKNIFKKIKKNKKSIIIISIIFIIFFLIVLATVILVMYNNKKDILTEKVFKTEDYTYLPKQAYNYVLEVYDSTGVILRTEKNKIEDEPYLNPEYVEYLVSGTASDSGYVPNSTIVEHDYSAEKLGSTALPSQYDSRNVDGKSYVTSVKDQSGYGLCWDFSLTSVLESKILKENLYTDSEELDLSERQIDYVRANPSQAVDIGKNPFFNGYPLDKLGGGGNLYNYFGAVSQGVSPIYEKDWKYGYDTSQKYPPEDIWNTEKTTYDVDGYYELPKAASAPKDEDLVPDDDFIDAVKSLIVEHGSVEISIATAHGNPYVQYTPTGNEQLLSSDTTIYNVLYYRDTSYIYTNDHSVAIIGWDDNYEHNVCIGTSGNLTDAEYDSTSNNYTCESGTLKKIEGAWIIKNSQGEKVSDFYAFNPYAYVAYDTVNSSYTSIYDVNLKNWDNAYTLRSATSKKMKNSSSSSSIEAIYKKNNTKEKINKIKFTTDYGSVVADIYVSTTGSDDDYEKVGTEIAIYPGLYTIDLSDSNILLEGNEYAIKVDFLNKASAYDSYNGITVFTNNVDEDIEIKMEDVELQNSVDYLNLIDDENVIVLNGTSRNLTNDQKINFVVKDSNGNDVTSKFNFYRNYEVSNYINTLVGFSDEVPLDTYTVDVLVDNIKYDDFTMKIEQYTENMTGTGTEEDPYIIANPKQLNMIKTNIFAFYKLSNDIDMTYDTQDPNGSFYNDGKGWEPISDFSGGLDGNGHKIIGLSIYRPDENKVGLFKRTYNQNYSNLYIKNVILEKPNIVGKDYVGGIVGEAYGSTYERRLTLENIGIISGTIKGNNYVGGIAGYLKAGDKENFRRHYFNKLYNSAKIESNDYAGGLFGYIETMTTLSTNITNVFNVGNISSSGYSGGIAGYNATSGLNIQNLYNTGIVNGTTSSEFVSTASNITLTNAYYYNTDKPVDGSYSQNNVVKHSYNDIKNDNIYSTWSDFDTNWEINTINDKVRIPTLKGVPFEYLSSMNSNTSNLNLGINNSSSANLNVSISDDISNKEVAYISNDTSIATVNDEGVVTAKGLGTTSIRVISKYDGLEIEIPVTVTGTVINVSDLKLDKTSLELDLKDNKTYQFSVTVSPENATNKDIIWTSSDTSVVTVDNTGKVTAVGSGTATITITSVDGNISKTCNVEVEEYLSFGDLNVDFENKIIKNIEVGISINTILNEIDTSGTVSRLDKNGNAVSNDTLVKTGDIIRIEMSDETLDYRISVLGDVTGDGVVIIPDVAKLYSHVRKTTLMTEAWEYVAGDLVIDNELLINDVAKLYSIVRQKG